MSLKIEYDEIIVTNGVKIPFVPRIITPKIERPMRNNRYESTECATIREILKAGDRVLEFGAGVGLLSTIAAQVEGVESVTAIEANPELVPVINETHRLNDVSMVELLNGVVVSNQRKRAPFYLRADFWASSMEPDSREYNKKKHLPCFNVQTLIEDKKPTVIVCDIEGGEVGLFDDADLSGVRAIVLEFHPKVYGAEIVEEITQGIEAKGLIFQKPNKPSTVRCFIRDKGAVISKAPTEKSGTKDRGKAVNPDLTGLKAKKWNPKTARYLVTTCMKDEGPFIIEWLAWHKSIGIQDFVVFTNDCTDGTDLLLDRLDEMGELRHLPNPALASANSRFQLFSIAYTPYLAEFKRADYYISMDVDEFINIRSGDGQMSDLLAKAGPFDALSMSELNHGSNMHEDFEPGLLIDQFPRHQREGPGAQKSRRGVKTIVRLDEKLQHVRNHRPDLKHDLGQVTWLDGSGRPLASLHDDPSENGIDVRGTYDLVVLDHFPLRSLNSYLVKMHRGDVVVPDKMVSPRYWRMRDRQSDLTSTFERQRKGFDLVYNKLMADKKLAAIHEKCCEAHAERIAEIVNVPVFQERKQWIFDNIWNKTDKDG